MKPIILILGWFSFFIVSLGAERNRYVADDAPPVPAGAKVVLSCSRESYRLGENVLLRVELQNTGAEPFEFSSGGDYRFARRSLRFQITATDEHGHTLADPGPGEMSGGGFTGSKTLEAGEKDVAFLALTRYRRFDAPGRYTIRATHDFGWKETPGRPRPVGETSVVFTMPDADEAERIAKQMEAMLPAPDNILSNEGSDFADFSCLRYPVYLRPLAERAWRGLPQALVGLGASETTDATVELIKLLDHPEPSMALAAAEKLLFRVPISAPPKRFSFWQNQWTERRQELAKMAWDERLASAVRPYAARNLESSEPGVVDVAANLLASIGTADDAPLLLATLDRKLAALPARREPEDHPLNPPANFDALIQAYSHLASGPTTAEQPRSPAGWLVWLEDFPPETTARPLHWEKACATLLTHPSPYLRMVALRVYAAAPREALRPAIAAAFADEDLGVQSVACELVTRMKDAGFRAQALHLFRTTRNDTAFYWAGKAVVATGSPLEVCEVWADRLDKREQLFEMLMRLLEVVVADDRSSASSGNSDQTPDKMRAIKQRWKSFLAEHGEAIRVGKKFSIGGPELTPDLVGDAFNLGLRDGRHWPPRQP